MHTQKYYLYSVTALAILSASAHAEQLNTSPTLEGGITASIGTFYAQPSSTTSGFSLVEGGTDVTVLEPDTDYDFGIQASLGYIFEGTANGIELSYRGINTSDTTSTQGMISLLPPDGGSEYTTADDKLEYTQNALDLMMSQYMDIGDYMQMRFSGGLSYIDFKQNQSLALANNDVHDSFTTNSDFKGLGPRMGIDARYDFGNGVGIVGGASFAYYLGDLDVNSYIDATGNKIHTAKDDQDNHAVINLRSNLAVDYVYFFDDEERSTLGLELGYEIDYYDNVIGQISPTATSIDNELETIEASFAGPYLLLKGVF